MDCSPPGSSVQGILQPRNTRVGYHALLQGIFPTQGLNLHHFTSPVLVGGFFTTSTTWEALSSQDFLFIPFIQDKIDNTPRNLTNPGIETVSLASLALAGKFFTTEPPRKPPEGMQSVLKLGNLESLVN